MRNEFKNYRYEDDELYITCTRCNKEKHCDNFWKNRNNPKLGYYYSCKECGNNKFTTLDNANEKFAIPAREILESMGYEVGNEENTVHEQFKERMKKKGRVW